MKGGGAFSHFLRGLCDKASEAHPWAFIGVARGGPGRDRGWGSIGHFAFPCTFFVDCVMVPCKWAATGEGARGVVCGEGIRGSLQNTIFYILSRFLCVLCDDAL